MISKIETFYRRLRRNLSRSEWLRRLLQLPVSRGAPTRPGLIIVQIDGLSQKEFTRALEHGELPFLRRLVLREHYQVHTQYSGLPTSTPATQGELFYGIKGIVPAFSFIDSKSGRVVRMYEPQTAAHIEAQLAERGEEGLLEGGSSYSNIFTGGAEESHFCPSSLGWGALQSANPLVVLALLFSNFYSFLRVGALLLLEFVLGVVDFLRGLILGQDFFKELKFIPTRVGICVLLRELCVIGGKIDIQRGLPIIHINFLGYDEQAHRRGPRSAFAHWTLKGIDDGIARLWRAASQSAWRHYEVWVYSDHGQVRAIPYHLVHTNQTLEGAVTTAFAKLETTPLHQKISESIQTQRVRLLGGKKFQRLFAVLGLNDEVPEEQEPQVVALGPVGLIYSPRQLNTSERDQIAHELSHTQKVPVVIVRENPNSLTAWTETGKFQLPRQMGEVFGSDHPFLDSIGEDLLRLCHHPESGDFVLLGWHKGTKPLTFATENGSHAGITPDETNAFCLLPKDTLLPERAYSYLRPGDLRQAALQYLGRLKSSPIIRKRSADTPAGRLRVMTYNVHRCVGMDSKLAVERIARVIARANPDVVALQELDVGRARTDGLDQAEMIAKYLEMEFHFHPALHVAEEKFGDAILTRLPQRLVKAGPLPGLDSKFRLEPRGALWLTVDLEGLQVQIINTHLGLHPHERLIQGQALVGNEWLGNDKCLEPIILCGDFNALPTSPVYRLLRKQFNDAQSELQRHRPRAVFPGRFPTGRIDHIFISPGLEVSNIEIPRSEMALVASDHLPLIAEIRIPVKNSIIE